MDESKQINDIYDSMSKIVEHLSTDNLVLNEHAKKICSDVENVQIKINGLKLQYDEYMMSNSAKFNILSEDITDIRKRLSVDRIAPIERSDKSSSQLDSRFIAYREHLMQCLNVQIENIRVEQETLKKTLNENIAVAFASIEKKVNDTIVQNIKHIKRDSSRSSMNGDMSGLFTAIKSMQTTLRDIEECLKVKGAEQDEMKKTITNMQAQINELVANRPGKISAEILNNICAEDLDVA